ncbi:MAG: ATP-binding protein [Woeseiaceae bacterium]|jgi:two-component system sensor histidine kinase PhoQ|nr:ATP-binding protein [Woeseiaceae bacterium]
MYSLNARLLISVSLLLLLFFGATIIVLDTAFRTAGERAREDILDGHLMSLFAVADVTPGGSLEMRRELPEPRFSALGSGLYAAIRNDGGDSVFESRSALGIDLPAIAPTAVGREQFDRLELQDGTPLLAMTLAVNWELGDGRLKPFVFSVYESLDGFNAQVASFRQQLFGWFAALAFIMLVSISILLRGLLRPLRQIETEIGEIEEGRRTSLSKDFPNELTGVARNMNLLIDSERARSDRYRKTLDNLAHSLKTPLAAMRSLSGDAGSADADRFNEQIDRMDEIVRYQLRKPGSVAGKHLLLAPVPIREETERLVNGLGKVYRDKAPDIDVSIDGRASFRGDTGDFLEMAGNLVDNACKWCRHKVRVTIKPAGESGLILTVADDGPGVPPEAREALLERGMRLDEKTPGHGIGLAIVRDIAESYGGHLAIQGSDLGGAQFTITIPPPGA